MSEVRPQITFTPDDGMLSVRTELHEPGFEDRRLETIERLKKQPGITVDGEEIIHIEVKNTLGAEFGFGQADKLDGFLLDLKTLIPAYSLDGTDRVFNAHLLSSRGFKGAIYPHSQRWLNAQPELSEQVARDTLQAMAIPFGPDKEQQATRSFSMIGEYVAEATFFKIYMKHERFGVSSIVETSGEFTEKSGQVRWNIVDLKTLGGCACMGVDDDKRRRVRTGTSTSHPWLYETSPHNIDVSRQSLSMLLGLGTLANYAAQYLGDEDIFTGTEWGEPRVYTKAAPGTSDEKPSAHIIG